MSVAMKTRLTKRLTIRLSERLAQLLTETALRVDQDESAYIRELLRRTLLSAERDTRTSTRERAA